MTEQDKPEGEPDWSSPLPEQQPPAGAQPPQQPPQPPAPGVPPQGQVPPQQAWGAYGAQQPPGPPPQKVDNFLIPAILSTIFCCLPVGIVAIVFASQVNSKLAAGDLAGAMDYAKKARLWTFISVGAGIAAIILYLMIEAASQSTV